MSLNGSNSHNVGRPYSTQFAHCLSDWSLLGGSHSLRGKLSLYYLHGDGNIVMVVRGSQYGHFCLKHQRPARCWSNVHTNLRRVAKGVAPARSPNFPVQQCASAGESVRGSINFLHFKNYEKQILGIRTGFKPNSTSIIRLCADFIIYCYKGIHFLKAH